MPSAYARAVDYGNPISFLALQRGTDVVSSDGKRVGKVEHVLIDEGSDIFDGLVIDIQTGPGGQRFADADQIDAIYERAVVLEVPAVDIENLPTPAPGPLRSKLNRAWNLISGKY